LAFDFAQAERGLGSISTRPVDRETRTRSDVQATASPNNQTLRVSTRTKGIFAA